jgi:predicted nucleotidyltransferase
MEQKDYTMEIVLELLKKENHVRGIAKALGTNHMTISRRIKELHKKNIVDYNEQGKNKTYFLKKTAEAKAYLMMAEHYKFVKTLEKYGSLRIVVDKIQKNKKIELALLFGSYAKGLAKHESDIDIYLDTTDRKIKQEIESVDAKASVKIGEFSADNLLIKEIIKNHVILKGGERYYEKIGFFS